MSKKFKKPTPPAASRAAGQGLPGVTASRTAGSIHGPSGPAADLSPRVRLCAMLNLRDASDNQVFGDAADLIEQLSTDDRATDLVVAALRRQVARRQDDAASLQANLEKARARIAELENPGQQTSQD